MCFCHRSQYSKEDKYSGNRRWWLRDCRRLYNDDDVGSTACNVVRYHVVWLEVIEKQVRGMEEYLEKMGYKSYDEFIGMSLQYLRSSSELEALEGWPTVDMENVLVVANVQSQAIGCH